MRKFSGQSSLRFTTEADPRYCASILCRMRRRKAPTHTVTIEQKTFRLCAACARSWESIRGARVEVIQEAAHA